MSSEDKIRAQNKELRNLIEGYMQEIQKLKQTNEQHETEIDTLLKFNERLLTIIETQLNQYNSKKSEHSLSLQPISQITQRDSDIAEVVGPIRNSFIKNKYNQEMQSKSEYGRQPLLLGNNKEELHSIDASKSDYKSEYMSEYEGKSDKMKEVLFLISEYRKEYGNSIQQYENMKKKIKSDLKTETQELTNISKENNEFYKQKKNQLQTLKQKLNSEVPEVHLQRIIKNNQYSPQTQNKLMKIMNHFK